jgi:hypothetical protein
VATVFAGLLGVVAEISRQISGNMRQKKLRARCAGKGVLSDLPYDLIEGTDEGTVHAVLQIGPHRFCSSFDDFNGADGSDGRRFRGKNSPSPTRCP